MSRNRIAMFGLSAALLWTGATVVGVAMNPAAAQTQTKQDQATKQAIDSIKKKRQEDPQDVGLRHAQECLENSAKCQDMKGLNEAMDSVRKCIDRDPKDAGLRHAMDTLQAHYQRMESHMPGGPSPQRPESGGQPHSGGQPDATGSHPGGEGTRGR